VGQGKRGYTIKLNYWGRKVGAIQAVTTCYSFNKLCSGSYLDTFMGKAVLYSCNAAVRPGTLLRKSNSAVPDNTGYGLRVRGKLRAGEQNHFAPYLAYEIQLYGQILIRHLVISIIYYRICYTVLKTQCLICYNNTCDNLNITNYGAK
jgi:hypothetical protein